MHRNLVILGFALIMVGAGGCTEEPNGLSVDGWRTLFDVEIGLSVTYGDPPYRGSPDWEFRTAEENSSIAWADFDGDGDLDPVHGVWQGKNRLLINDGEGQFTEPWVSPSSFQTTSVAWGDYDGDGDPDLAVGNYGEPNQLFENDGGTLSLVWTSAEIDDTEVVAWGDPDGDGDLDLAVGNTNLSPNRLYINDGWWPPTSWTFPSPGSTLDMAWGDLTGDGLPDLAVATDIGESAYR